MLISTAIKRRSYALVGIVIFSSHAQALFFAEKFSTPGIVKQKVNFWQQIFYHYDSSKIVVHDTHRVDLVLDVINYQRTPQLRSMNWREKQRYAQRYVDRYRKAMRRFQKYKLKARKFGGIERRVYEVYRKDIGYLLAGKVRLRSQTGMSDAFHQAIKRAEPFMPHMENIFAAHRLPKELIRLTFVESMFNYQARSKVGAAGIWQFMPSTGREFLHVNALTDERISPLKSTKAAAKLLRRNYRMLGNWPLAITAYNQGVASMKKAVNSLNTRNIDVIIRKYRGKYFGFAGRNFYSEFIAASKVYNYLHSKRKSKGPPISLVSLRLPKKVSTAKLIKRTSLSKKILGKYNPCFSPKAFTSKRYAKLPPYYEIYVPSKIAAKVKNELRSI